MNNQQNLCSWYSGQGGGARKRPSRTAYSVMTTCTGSYPAHDVHIWRETYARTPLGVGRFLLGGRGSPPTRDTDLGSSDGGWIVLSRAIPLVLSLSFCWRRVASHALRAIRRHALRRHALHPSIRRRRLAPLCHEQRDNAHTYKQPSP